MSALLFSAEALAEFAATCRPPDLLSPPYRGHNPPEALPRYSSLFALLGRYAEANRQHFLETYADSIRAGEILAHAENPVTAADIERAFIAATWNVVPSRLWEEGERLENAKSTAALLFYNLDDKTANGLSMPDVLRLASLVQTVLTTRDYSRRG